MARNFQGERLASYDFCHNPSGLRGTSLWTSEPPCGDTVEVRPDRNVWLAGRIIEVVHGGNENRHVSVGEWNLKQDDSYRRDEHRGVVA